MPTKFGLSYKTSSINKSYLVTLIFCRFKSFAYRLLLFFDLFLPKKETAYRKQKRK